MSESAQLFNTPHEHIQALHKPSATKQMPDINFSKYDDADFSFPLVIDGDMESWMTGTDGLSEDGPYFQHLPVWDGTGTTGECWGQGGMDTTSAYQIPIDPFPYNDAANDIFSQHAAERALYMTPACHPISYLAFPVSPLSDPCSTPDSSSTSSRWETDHNRADVHPCHSSPPASASYSLPSHTSPQNFFPREAVGEDWFTTLEMPDGSTRKSSNWLPVDSTAGFTIESEPQYHRNEHHEDWSSMDNFQSIQHAFIPQASVG